MAGRSILNAKTKAKSTLELNLGRIAGAFVNAVVEGAASEYGVYSPRGEGKTQAALAAMILHGQKHAALGFEPPTRWMGVADSFRSHELKTHVSLNKPFWQGAWRLLDDGHLAVFYTERSPLVAIDLFGVEDRSATDRLKQECVGLWMDEVAPSREGVVTSGIDNESWTLALTSRRVQSYSMPAIFTTNPGDDDHWSVMRMKPGPQVEPFCGYHPNFAQKLVKDGKEIDNRRAWFRLPKGDNPHVSDEVRERNEASIEDEQMRMRLSYGEFGSIKLGPQVAEGFDRARHVAKERIVPNPSEPLFLGFDCWHTPVCVIGQEYKGQVRMLAALYIQGRSAGIRELIRDHVRPWIAKNAGWAFNSSTMLLHGVDPSGETGDQSDPDQNCFQVIEELLGAQIEPGPVKWNARIGPLLSLFSKHNGIIIDPIDGDPIVKSFGGRWYYPQDRFGNVTRDLPKKPNHPWEDIGDAALYCINRIAPSAAKIDFSKSKVQSDFNVFDHNYGAVQGSRVLSDW